MNKEPQILDWRYLDDHPADTQAWLDLVPTEKHAKSDTTGEAVRAGAWWSRRIWFTLLGGSLLILASVGYGLWWQATAGLAQIHAEVAEAAALDIWHCWQARSAHVRETQIVVSAPADAADCPLWVAPLLAQLPTTDRNAVQVTIEEIDLVGDRAVVRVLLTPGGASDDVQQYRASAFYRQRTISQMDADWRLTAPTSTILGPVQRANTNFFRFQTSAREADIIEPIVAAIDEVYADLRRALGLPPAASDQKLTIRTATARLPLMRGVYRNRVPETLVIPSPLVLAQPADSPYTDLLTAEIVRLLRLRLLDEAVAHANVPERWQTMVDGIYLHVTRVNDGAAIHHHVQELRLPLMVIQWHAMARRDVRRNPVNPAMYWAAESLAEYLVVTYGWTKVGELIAGLSQHETWETLAPAVFGVSARTLQAAWHEYVTAAYPLGVD